MTDDDDAAAATLDGALARRWLDEFVAAFQREAQRLGDLDRQAGDGDFGTNLTSALGKAKGFVERLQPETFRGRASYVGEVARGVLDPGAVTVALFFAAGAAAATTAPPA